MLWFFLSSNLSMPYKIKSINLFSFSVEKEMSILFNSFIRADLFALQKWEVKLFDRCSLLFARCSLLVTFCSLLVTFCWLLFARCLLLFARYFFLVARQEILNDFFFKVNKRFSILICTKVLFVNNLKTKIVMSNLKTERLSKSCSEKKFL